MMRFFTVTKRSRNPKLKPVVAMAHVALHGRKILLGISGSIAAYKAVYLTRLLVKEGAEVRVLMTPAAALFISPLTFSTLSRYPVQQNLMDEGEWQNHVELGMWADLMLIVPATANTLSAMAQGRCDNLLLAVFLSAKCPVWVAPAMDLDMWRHPATQRNMASLSNDGVYSLPVGDGELASGLSGPGRLAEPEEILTHIIQHFQSDQSLAGVHVLITAGPTLEHLDPVRFISNHSTGKMGIALADELARRGAEVHLILGPTALRPSSAGVKTIEVTSADEMLAAAKGVFPLCRVAIFSAAVADYRPAETSVQKIKKTADSLSLSLVKNPDIAAILASQKTKAQLLIGFALETENGEENARKKMASKQLDMIVLNSLHDEGAGFGTDTNKVTLLTPDNKSRSFGLKSKVAVAKDIIDALAQLLHAPK